MKIAESTDDNLVKIMTEKARGYDMLNIYAMDLIPINENQDAGTLIFADVLIGSNWISKAEAGKNAYTFGRDLAEYTKINRDSKIIVRYNPPIQDKEDRTFSEGDYGTVIAGICELVLDYRPLTTTEKRDFIRGFTEVLKKRK